MNNAPDNQKITAYLLGALPAAETEDFDERSFTDDDFAQILTAAENDLIDGYLHNELSGETLAKFESFYLASPLRREKVEFARSLQAAAGREQIEKTAVRESASLFSRLKNYRLQFAFAFSALLVLIFGAFFFMRRNATEIVNKNSPAPANQPNPQNQPEIAAVPNTNLPNDIESSNTNKETVNKNTNAAKSPQPTEKPTVALPPPQPKPALASLVLMPPLRNNQLPNFPISKETTDVAVRLELESNEFSAYRVTLTDEAGNSLRQFANLRARGNSLSVRFPAKMLKDGVYTFEVSGVKNGAAEIISNYTFRVVLK